MKIKKTIGWLVQAIGFSLPVACVVFGARLFWLNTEPMNGNKDAILGNALVFAPYIMMFVPCVITVTVLCTLLMWPFQAQRGHRVALGMAGGIMIAVLAAPFLLR